MIAGHSKNKKFESLSLGVFALFFLHISELTPISTCAMFILISSAKLKGTKTQKEE